MSCQSTSLREPSSTVFADPARGVSVDVPPRWYAVPAEYSPHHYLEIFLTINNHIPGFHLRDRPGGIQVQPGMICICIGEGERGPLTDPSAFPTSSHPQDHSFETAVDLVRKALATGSSGTMQYAEVSFARAGGVWQIVVYAAKPYSDQDKQRALAIIRGIRFSEVQLPGDGKDATGGPNRPRQPAAPHWGG
jgi:hypothetical protein